MIPPIFETCAADDGVTALLGTNPVRLYQFGFAPQNVAKPYAVWQTIGGVPGNYITGLPDHDQIAVQVDVYGITSTEARGVALALRDAIEPHAHITAWRGEDREPETALFRVSFDLDWFVHR